MWCCASWCGSQQKAQQEPHERVTCLPLVLIFDSMIWMFDSNRPRSGLSDFTSVGVPPRDLGGASKHNEWARVGRTPGFLNRAACRHVPRSVGGTRTRPSRPSSTLVHARPPQVSRLAFRSCALSPDTARRRVIHSSGRSQVAGTCARYSSVGYNALDIGGIAWGWWWVID